MDETVITDEPEMVPADPVKDEMSLWARLIRGEVDISIAGKLYTWQESSARVGRRQALELRAIAERHPGMRALLLHEELDDVETTTVPDPETGKDREMVVIPKTSMEYEVQFEDDVVDWLCKWHDGMRADKEAIDAASRTEKSLAFTLLWKLIYIPTSRGVDQKKMAANMEAARAAAQGENTQNGKSQEHTN